MSNIFQGIVSDLRVGGYAMLDGHACRITSISHGKVEGTDLFTLQRHHAIFDDNQVDVPLVTERVYRFIDVGEDAVCNLEDGEGEHVYDFFLPDCDIGGKMQDAVRAGRTPTVVTVEWNGNRRIAGIVHF